MSERSPWVDSQLPKCEQLLGRINASLFYQLAQILLWGKERPEVVAAYPDFADLLQSAGSALMEGGILDHQDGFPAETSGTDSKSSTSGSVFRPEGRA